ncbi:MAG: hypothetical protein SGJ18_06585 [Pseudomonadota bacterium]|nr:hypothetical protein [Pseudomonadota bacterium]
MICQVLGIILLLSSYSQAAIKTGKLFGSDNYGSPCWIEITEAKNQNDPLLINHSLNATLNYSSDSYTLTHGIEQVNFVFRPAPLAYSGRSLKSGRTDITDISAAMALVSLTIDENHKAVSFSYWDNSGGEKEFKRRNYICQLTR